VYILYVFAFAETEVNAAGGPIWLAKDFSFAELITVNEYYYYAAFNAPCVGHKADNSQAQGV